MNTHRTSNDFSTQNKKNQGFSSDFRYVEPFSGHSVKFRQNLVQTSEQNLVKYKCSFSQMWPCCFFLRRSIFSLFSFLPHIFLVIDCQWSWSANRRENRTFLIMLFENLWQFLKIRDENLLNCWCRRGAKESKSDRSRQELSNEYLLAKFGFDTAENEPFNFHDFSSLQGFNFHGAVVSCRHGCTTRRCSVKRRFAASIPWLGYHRERRVFRWFWRNYHGFSQVF